LLAGVPLAPGVDSGAVGWKTAYAGKGNGGGGNGGGGNGGGGGGNSRGGGSAGGGTGGGTPGGAANNSAANPDDSLYSGGGAKDRDRTLIVEQGVAVAQFTTRISKRIPADDIVLYDNSHHAISFFSELHGMAGRTITHRWTYGGTVEYETRFKIRGPSWKIWSTQMLPADKAGTWRVEIVDDAGKILTGRDLIYQPAG
jgi:hypothetical protein